MLPCYIGEFMLTKVKKRTKWLSIFILHEVLWNNHYPVNPPVWINNGARGDGIWSQYPMHLMLHFWGLRIFIVRHLGDDLGRGELDIWSSLAMISNTLSFITIFKSVKRAPENSSCNAYENYHSLFFGYSRKLFLLLQNHCIQLKITFIEFITVPNMYYC